MLLTVTKNKYLNNYEFLGKKDMSWFALLVAGIKHLSVLVSAAVGLSSAKRKLQEKRLEKLERQYISTHAAVATVFPILSTCLNKFKEVDRVTVFKSHNGNGLPQPGTSSYTTCVHEIVNHKLNPLIELWQKIPSDQEMFEIIGATIDEGLCVIEVPDHGEGILSDYCSGNGVKGVLSIPILVTNSGFLFLNFCSATVSDLTEVDGIEFEAKSVAARIAEIYKTAK